jgi:hypothetical protein
MLQENKESPRMDPIIHCLEAFRKVQSQMVDVIKFSKNKLEIRKAIPSSRGNWEFNQNRLQRILYEEVYL